MHFHQIVADNIGEFCGLEVKLKGDSFISLQSMAAFATIISLVLSIYIQFFDAPATSVEALSVAGGIASHINNADQNSVGYFFSGWPINLKIIIFFISLVSASFISIYVSLAVSAGGQFFGAIITLILTPSLTAWMSCIIFHAFFVSFDDIQKFKSTGESTSLMLYITIMTLWPIINILLFNKLKYHFIIQKKVLKTGFFRGEYLSDESYYKFSIGMASMCMVYLLCWEVSAVAYIFHVLKAT